MKRNTKLLHESLQYARYVSEAIESLKRSEPSARATLNEGQVALTQSIAKLEEAFKALETKEEKQRADSNSEEN